MITRPIDALFPEHAEARAKGVCPFCDKVVDPAALKAWSPWSWATMNDFRDAIDLREFHISGLCQSCQDEMF